MCNSMSGSFSGTWSKSKLVSAVTATGTSVVGRTEVIVFSMAPATSDSSNRSGSFFSSSLRNTATTAGISRIGNNSACSLNTFRDIITACTYPKRCTHSTATTNAIDVDRRPRREYEKHSPEVDCSASPV